MKSFEEKRVDLCNSEEYGKSLHSENLDQVLERIIAESDHYIDWYEFIQYFTKRGFPMYDDMM